MIMRKHQVTVVTGGDRNFVFYKNKTNNRFIIKNSEGDCHVRFDGDRIRFTNNCEDSATKYPITITHSGQLSSQSTPSGRLGGRFIYSNGYVS